MDHFVLSNSLMKREIQKVEVLLDCGVLRSKTLASGKSKNNKQKDGTNRRGKKKGFFGKPIQRCLNRRKIPMKEFDKDVTQEETRQRVKWRLIISLHQTWARRPPKAREPVSTTVT